MDFDSIEWDGESDSFGNVEHIARHGLTPTEVEEVLQGTGPEIISKSSPYRPAKMGWTTTGKFLFVPFERTEESGVVVIDPVTADEIDPP
jgi:hypothetical protein